METSAPSLVHPSHALAIYAEPLLRGRRVLVVGDATTGLGERIAAQGARVVHVYDPDEARGRRAAMGTRPPVSVFALPESGFDVRDGAFDLAIVPDLGVADPPTLLARLRKLIGPEGALVLGARNREAAEREGEASFDYYELYDSVSLQFANVRMVAEIPFSGLALAELGKENPEVSVDTQLAPEGPAPRFIVVASQTDVSIDPYSIIQLDEAPQAKRGGEKVELATSAALRVEIQRAQVELDAKKAEAEAARGRVSALETEAAELRLLAEKAKASEARAGDNHVRAERLAQEVRKLEEELERQRARAFKLTRDVEEEKKARTKSDVELGMLRKSPELAEARARIIELEVALSGVEKTVVDDRAVRSNILELEAATADAARAVAGERAALARVAELETALILAEKGLLDERSMRSRVEAAHKESMADAARARAAVAELRQKAHDQFEAAHKRVEALEAQLEGAALAQEELARAAAIEQKRTAAALGELNGYAERHAEELGGIERTLHDRAKMIHLLESELGRRERMIRELVSTVEELHEAGNQASGQRVDTAVRMAHDEQLSALSRELEARTLGVRQAEERAEKLFHEIGALRTRLDALALETARREGDLQTHVWRIDALERELAASKEALREAARAAERPAPPVAAPAEEIVAKGGGDAALRQALDEIDLLKSALVQEHEVRQRLESGEELSLARSEIARQAILLEQVAQATH